MKKRGEFAKALIWLGSITFLLCLAAFCFLVPSDEITERSKAIPAAGSGGYYIAARWLTAVEILLIEQDQNQHFKFFRFSTTEKSKSGLVSIDGEVGRYPPVRDWNWRVSPNGKLLYWESADAWKVTRTCHAASLDGSQHYIFPAPISARASCWGADSQTVIWVSPTRTGFNLTTYNLLSRTWTYSTRRTEMSLGNSYLLGAGPSGQIHFCESYKRSSTSNYCRIVSFPITPLASSPEIVSYPRLPGLQRTNFQCASLSTDGATITWYLRIREHNALKQFVREATRGSVRVPFQECYHLYQTNTACGAVRKIGTFDTSFDKQIGYVDRLSSQKRYCFLSDGAAFLVDE